MRTVLLALLALTGPVRALAADPVTIVFCAPGYPGSTAEAQPSMDAFAAAVADAAGWPAGSVRAVYESTEKAGLSRLGQRDAAATIVPLPFFLVHARALDLAPRLQVEAQGASTETWSLVAKKGRVSSPAALAGMTVASLAGYAPEFVRSALGSWGRIPAEAKVVESSQVLSWLRKAATGADAALLVDSTQAAALPTLPFAADLDVVARSAPLPAAFVATVGDRLPAARAKALAAALRELPRTPRGAEALKALRIDRFVPVDEAALASARKLAGGPR
jgi:ABC-type phosphate/phosphonate transport system substrate-binding protein